MVSTEYQCASADGADGGAIFLINGTITVAMARQVAIVRKASAKVCTCVSRHVSDQSCLSADRKPADDFKNLRQEVLDLQKATRDLHKQLDELQSESKGAASAKAAGTADTKSKKKQKPGAAASSR
jgi:hypothetical protein